MGLAHTRAGPGGAIARSGGKVVVLGHPLFILPASAVFLDLSVSLLGYEALFRRIRVSAARVDVFVIVAPQQPQVSAQEPASVSGPGVWRGASGPMPAPYDGERRVRREGQKGPRGFLRVDL